MHDESVVELQKRAKRGDAHAQYSLGIRFANGEGVVADSFEARRMYLAAAKQCHPDAAFNLAAMLLHGEGGEQDLSRALRWFHRASGFGSSDATIWLGESSLSGSEFREALKYFGTAMMQGDVRALRGVGLVLSDVNCDVPSSEAGKILLDTFHGHGEVTRRE